MYFKDRVEHKFTQNWDGDYNSALGRFISEDSIGFQGGESNLHIYAKNNPVINIDPTGEITVGTILAAVNGIVSAYIAYNLYKIYQSAVYIADQVKANNKRILNLENQLLLDDCLTKAERMRIRRQIKSLQAFNDTAVNEISRIKRLFTGLLIREAISNTSLRGEKLNPLEQWGQNVFTGLLD